MEQKAELDSLRQQSKRFREAYEELREQYDLLSQRHEEAQARGRRLEERYAQLRQSIQAEEEKYRRKTSDLLRQIESLKELVKTTVQARHQTQKSNIVSVPINIQINNGDSQFFQPPALDKKQGSRRSGSVESQKRNGGNYAEILEHFYSNRSN